MAISSYERLFAPRTMGGVVEVFAREDANSRMAAGLFQRSARKIDPLVDGSCEWEEVQFSRHLAPVVGRDSPAVRVNPLGRILRNTAPAHVKISKWIPAHKLHGDRGLGSLLPNAQQVVDQELKDGAKILNNTREYLAMGALFGTVTVNSTTIPGTTMPFTLSFSPNTYTASNSWATAGTGIVSAEVPAAKLDYMQAHGLLSRQVIAGSTISGYLRSNTEIQNHLRETYGKELMRSAAELFSMSAFEGLEIAGLRWMITEEGYVPEGGSFTRYVPATDKAVMLPEDNELNDVLGQIEAYGLVPRSAADVLTASAAAADAVGPAPSRGAYAYAIRHLNPLGVEIIMGWSGIYVLLTPNGVIVLDVVP